MPVRTFDWESRASVERRQTFPTKVSLAPRYDEMHVAEQFDTKVVGVSAKLGTLVLTTEGTECL